MVYIGAEYCPFCAAQRWGVIVALARFGSFTGLGASHSAADDVYPNTATLTFHGASYTSSFVEFQGVETATNQREGGRYAPLDALTPLHNQLMRTYNAPPYTDADSAGAIPFMDFGNRYILSGSSVSPELLAGRSVEEIAAALADPSSPIAKAIDGSANVYTAIICGLTSSKPATVCASPAVLAYQSRLHAS